LIIGCSLLTTIRHLKYRRLLSLEDFKICLAVEIAEGSIAELLPPKKR